MKNSFLRRSAVLIALIGIGLYPILFADSSQTAKKSLSYEAYDSWNSIQGAVLSRDGIWLAYARTPQDGDGELIIRNLRTDREYKVPRGANPVITPESSHVVFSVTPLKVDRDKARKDKKKPEDGPKPGVGILDLVDGTTKSFDGIKSFKIAEDGGSFVARLLEPKQIKEEDKPAGDKEKAKNEGDAKKKNKEPGTDLVVRNLATGGEIVIPDVVEYVWNKPGTWLAYSVSSKTPENDGAFALRPADGSTRSLLKGNGHYKGFAFDEKGNRLAFVSDRDAFKDEAPAFRLYVWDTISETSREAAPSGILNFPAGLAVSENGALSFSRDGQRLFFGIAPAPRAEAKDAPEPVKVDIWNWKDGDLQTAQKVRAEDEKKHTDLCALHLDAGKGGRETAFVRLGSPDLPRITLSDDGRLAIGWTDIPYKSLVSWDRGYGDVYFIDLRDGSRKKVFDKTPYPPEFSPSGKYLVIYDDARQWRSYRIEDGRMFDLTIGLGIPFADEEHDEPGAPRPYGTAGWTENDGSILICDRYDIWEIRPDGTGARKITADQGRGRKTAFRYLKLDPEEKFIPSKKSLLLSALNEDNQETGFYDVNLSPWDKSKPGPAQAPGKLIMLDKKFGHPLKARNADAFVFTIQRFDEFPDLWTSDGSFAAPRRVSDANPQQAEFLWGKAELIDYTNADGKPLRAILIKPEGFDPSKKYPLMVYIYEKLSDGLHRYSPPAPGTNINVARYVSNGYVVLEPDIVYETGYPGQGALKCVVPAVEKIVSMGFVDPKRIGIQGHSWGGYEISYLITRTDLFAAVEAGASVVNMTSAYGGIRWGTGLSRSFQYEKSQSRIGGAPWTYPLQYIENSPLFWVEKVRTPYLTLHNDEDDAVPWYQGIEFFIALRRLGKEAYLFNFNGDKHGLRERTNQKYWTVHLDEFFDHFLKGAPRPDWMEKGVPYLERGKRDIDGLFKKKNAASAP